MRNLSVPALQSFLVLACFLSFDRPAVSQNLAMWIDVPFVKQPEEGCGAASLSMVMQYWFRHEGRTLDDSTDATKIQSALYSPQAHGIFASAMQTYLRDHGFQAFAFSGQWDDLEHNIAKGRPLIAAVRPTGRNVPLHYLVVVGLDPENKLVMVNDPAVRKLLKEDRFTFEKEWSATNRWLLLTAPATANQEKAQH